MLLSRGMDSLIAVRNNPVQFRIVVSVLLMGSIFFIFAWVPYNKTGRELKLLARKISLAQNNLQEFKSLFNLAQQNNLTGDLGSVVSYLEKQTEVSEELITAIDDLGKLSKNNNLGSNFSSAITFYPGFTKHIINDLQIESVPNTKLLNELKSAVELNQSLNKALLNLVVFEPDVFFDKPLTSYSSDELRKKLIPLNEAVGGAVLELSALDQNSDKRITPILNLVKLVSQRINTIIGYANKGNLKAAETENKRLISDMTSMRNSLLGKNSYLLKSNLGNKYKESIDQMVISQKELLKKTNSVLDRYY